MTWRRIVIYYALAGVLGGYFFAFVYEAPHNPLILQEPRVPDRQFLPLLRDEIHEMALFRDQEPTLRFRLTGQRWEVVEPAGASVTSAVIESFVENLTPEKEIRLIDANPSDLAVYGLDAPSSTIVVQGENGLKQTTVEVGDLNPASSAYYGRRTDSPEIVLFGYNVGYYADLMFQSARRRNMSE